MRRHRFSITRLTAAVLIAGCLGASGLAPAQGDPRSPAVIWLSPDCGDLAGTLQVRVNVEGFQFNPYTAVVVTFDAGTGGIPTSVAADSDGFGHFAIDLVVGGRPPGSHVVRADDFEQREAEAAFISPCAPGQVTTTTTPVPAPTVAPRLTLLPPLGPPGFVSKAVGDGFPVNSPVSLSWAAPELTGPLGAPVADAGGHFEIPVLIFPRVSLGPRQLRAGPGPGSAPFAETDATFQVVAPSVQPPDFKARR